MADRTSARGGLARRSLRGALVLLTCAVLGATGCEILFYGYLGYELYDRYINRDKGDRTTRIVYLVQSSGAGNPAIVGARLELYALRTGGTPSNPDDFETIADAVRETNEDGEAIVYVKADPREAEDRVIQPSVIYREVLTAPGFLPYEGVREGIGASAGLVEADAIRLVPK